ncbi:MAG: queuosine precursor transporter [Saprospiraceae bacterium]|jgi:uncharacterized PurR-regulated membrane protein YhhQ (DUF165 family)|nr:queuosine precursor transporter [Saprospiraceae bacterium]
MLNITGQKPIRLFLILGAIFITNALVAEFIGVKIFSLEKTLGISPLNLNILGFEGLSFNLTTGVLLWPVVFVMTDIINEYFGVKGVRFLSNLAIVLIIYAFFIVFIGIRLTPADFWPESHINPGLPQAEQDAIRSKVSDYNYAFRLVFNQGLWIIIGSLVAFLVGQILDVFIFHKIKKWTGEKKIWLRATGSTLISQLIDSFVVLFIAFYIGADWSLSLVLAIGLVNYFYKFAIAIALTPVIYLVHYLIDSFLGEELSNKLKQEAMRQKIIN